MRVLTPNAEDRVRTVRMLVMDVDGVLTDGKVLYTDSFEGLLFNVHDGAGIKYLHRCGLRTAMISGRETEAVERRAATLGVEHVIQGATVKMTAYEEVRRRTDLSDEQIAYVGDDLTDLPVLRRAGLAIAVANAVQEVVEAADVVTDKRGGDGAVREVAEFILKSQDKWGQVLARYLEIWVDE